MCNWGMASTGYVRTSRSVIVFWITKMIHVSDVDSDDHLAVCRERPCKGSENNQTMVPVVGICEDIDNDLICGVGFVIQPNPYGEGDQSNDWQLAIQD